MKQPVVYILTNKVYGTLYTGVTSNLKKRIWEHKNKMLDGFSKRYNLSKLIYFEIHTEIREAIKREKQIKKWNRAWKIELIEKSNPDWRDLWEDII